jgi:hypothetical protein
MVGVPKNNNSKTHKYYIWVSGVGFQQKAVESISPHLIKINLQKFTVLHNF